MVCENSGTQEDPIIRIKWFLGRGRSAADDYMGRLMYRTEGVALSLS